MTDSAESIAKVERPRYKPKSLAGSLREGQQFGGQVTSSQFSKPREVSELQSIAFLNGEDFQNSNSKLMS